MSWTRANKPEPAPTWPARLSFAAAALTLCTTASPPAFAQARSGDAAMAETLFNEAKRKMAAGDFAAACPKLAESYRLDPGSGTLTALAVCHESLGKTASAWTEFIEVVTEARQAGRADRQKFAQQHVDALEPKLSKLTVVVDPALASLPGLEVRRDGTVIGQAGWGTAAPVDPGAHTVEVKAPGKKSWSATITLGAASDLQSVTVPPLEDGPASSPSDAASPSPSGEATLGGHAEAAAQTEQPEPSPPSANNTRRTIAYVVGGAGLVAGGFGTYFGLQAISKAHDANAQCPDSAQCNSMDAVNTNNDAKSSALAADILLGGALVAVGVGAVLYLTAPVASSSPSSARVRVVPIASTRGGSVMLDAIW